MKNSSRISAATGVKLALTAVALCSLAACGGGGGGGSDTAGNGQPQAPAASNQLSLTSSNYLSGVQEVLSADAKLQTGGGTVTSVLGVDTTAASSAVQRVQALLPLVDASLRAPSVATGVTQSATQACPVSGTLSVTANDNNNTRQLDTGDSAVIVFNDCKDGTATTSGTLTMTVNSLTGSLTTSVYNADFTGVFAKLKTVAAAESLVMDGTTRIILEASSVGTKSRLSTDTFDMTGTLGGVNFSRVFTKFDSVHTRTADSSVGYRDSITITGSLNSSNLNSQAVQIATITPLVSTSSGLVSGELQVTGAANSKARLTADGANKALIELDANGDGTYEAKTTAAWPMVRP